MEPRQPLNHEIIIWKGKNKPRLMTVIQGIPFYCSSGRNSHQPKTWFPHRGIKSEDSWIMKPRSSPRRRIANFPQELLTFWEKNNYAEQIAIGRFGSLLAMCMSASLGGGFWDTEKGVLLKIYLESNYSRSENNDANYFLAPQIVDNIKSNLTKIEQHTLFDNAYEINEKLVAMGSIIYPGDNLTRLPSKFELEVFQREHSDIAHILLKELLKSNLAIDERHYQLILELSKNDEAVSYITEEFMLEDQTQAEAIFDLIKERKEKITTLDLEKINVLADLPNLSEYSVLQVHEKRHALRTLSREDAVNADTLELVEVLYDENLLYLNMDLIQNHLSRNLLIALLKKDKLDEDTLKIVRELFGSKAFILMQQIIENPMSCQVALESMQLNGVGKKDINEFLQVFINKKRKSSDCDDQPPAKKRMGFFDGKKLDKPPPDLVQNRSGFDNS